MTLFANDKIRVCYFLPMHEGEARATFINTNPIDAAKSGRGKMNLTEAEETQIRFMRTNSFR